MAPKPTELGGYLLVSRAEMARRLGVTRAAVTRACRPGGRLAAACMGKGVNTLHEAAARWLAQRAAAADREPIAIDTPDAPDEGDESEPAQLPLMGPHGVAAQVLGKELVDLIEPLATLTDAYGAAPAFNGWVKSRKTLEEALKAQRLRARLDGRLIARTTVEHMLAHVDTAFRLLLTDAPRTIATRLSAPDLPAATAMIRDVMSQALEACREHMAASLEADDPMAPLVEAAE